MVYVYAVDITGLPDPLENPRIMEGLWENRKQKILKCRQEKGRKQSLGAGLLLRYVLKEFGLQESEIKFGPNGKPELEGIFFNLSHSKDVVICAVGEDSVGCDIEQISIAPEKVADRFFGEREREYLSEFTGEEKNRQFYRLWTMKESYIKMTGEGMQFPLHRFELHFGEKIQVCREGAMQNCFVKEYELSRDKSVKYQVSVCAKEGHFAEQIIFKEWEGWPLEVKRP